MAITDVEIRRAIAVKRQDLFVITDKMNLQQVDKLVITAQNILTNNSIRRPQNRAPINEPFNLTVNFAKQEKKKAYYAQVKLCNRRSGASYSRIGEIVKQINKYYNANTSSTYIDTMRKLIVHLVNSGRSFNHDEAIAFCKRYGLNINI